MKSLIDESSHHIFICGLYSLYAESDLMIYTQSFFPALEGSLSLVCSVLFPLFSGRLRDCPCLRTPLNTVILPCLVWLYVSHACKLTHPILLCRLSTGIILIMHFLLISQPEESYQQATKLVVFVNNPCSSTIGYGHVI